MLRLVDQQLFHAVQKISAERGHDPRHFILVAAGGAGPMHGSSIGRKLESPAVYVPRLAGAFCALGMLNVPIKHEFARVFLGSAEGLRLRASSAPIYEALEAQARARLKATGSARATSRSLREIELRHPGQIGTIRVTVSPETKPPTRVAMRDDFLAAYQRLYGHRDSNVADRDRGGSHRGPWAVSGVRAARRRGSRGRSPGRPQRLVYFDEASGWVATHIYRGVDLTPGAAVDGPAIIEEATTCVIVAPGDGCTVDSIGNFLIRFDEGARA